MLDANWIPTDCPPEKKEQALLCHYIFQCAEAFGFLANLITTTANWLVILAATQLKDHLGLLDSAELFEWDISILEKRLISELSPS